MKNKDLIKSLELYSKSSKYKICNLTIEELDVVDKNGTLTILIIEQSNENLLPTNSICEVIKNLKQFDLESDVNYIYNYKYLCNINYININSSNYIDFNLSLPLTEIGYVGESKHVSDGYHTFDELYEHRLLLNASLFNEWYINNKYNCHKSLKHHDGSLPFNSNEYFIVCALLPTGLISYHYKKEYWNLFKIPATDKALFKYDNHNGFDVINRLKSLNGYKFISTNNLHYNK